MPSGIPIPAPSHDEPISDECTLFVGGPEERDFCRPHRAPNRLTPFLSPNEFCLWSLDSGCDPNPPWIDQRMLPARTPMSSGQARRSKGRPRYVSSCSSRLFYSSIAPVPFRGGLQLRALRWSIKWRAAAGAGGPDLRAPGRIRPVATRLLHRLPGAFCRLA
jgi:hypothetical protein